MFHDDGVVPNNTRLPLLYYRGALDLGGTRDPAGAIETLFNRNGWGGMWRNGIYPFVHYHSQTHEALGIARGRATVRFGGDQGQELEIGAGDVALLPAGTGHQCLWASPDLVGDRRLSPRGTLRSLPRQQGRARQGAAIDSESAAAKVRSGPRREWSAAGAVAEVTSFSPLPRGRGSATEVC